MLQKGKPEKKKKNNYLKPVTVLLSRCRTDNVVIRPLMTVSAMMLFSLIGVAATTRHSNSSAPASAPVGTSDILRLQEQKKKCVT